MGGTLSQPCVWRKSRPSTSHWQGRATTSSTRAGCRAKAAQAEPQSQEGPRQDKGAQDGQPENIEQEPQPAVVEQQQGKGQQGQLDEEGDQQNAGQ